MSHTFEQCC